MARRRRGESHVYRERVDSFDDFDIDIIPAREERGLRSGGISLVDYSPGKGRSQWQRTDEWVVEDRMDFALDTNEELYDAVLNADICDPVGWNGAESGIGARLGKKRKRKTMRAKRPNIYWKLHYRDQFLRELLRGKGRGDARNQRCCPDCKGGNGDVDTTEDREPRFRCEDCFGGELVCASCCKRRHRRLPFHRIDEWTGTHFTRTTLRKLGVSIQLNHSGFVCPMPVKGHTKLRILHINGIHKVDLWLCGCPKRRPQFQQLLRRGLYPGTVTEGRITTCATFAFMETLHLTSFTTKGSTYDFYRALEKLTDNTGLKVPKSRYRPLLRMIRQWRHLKMVIWSGAAHDPDGVEGLPDDADNQRLKEGRLVVRCPSCPRPGINLPDGWEEATQTFLYQLCLCIDANFRLKEQKVSSHSRDPSLNNGLGYFVKRVEYEKWVLQNPEGDQITTCVPLAALSKQNTKFSKGLRYTGVGGVCCGRSDMFVKLGNLHKGERYRNMDYIVGVAMRDFLTLLLAILVYDIACQWFINLYDRIKHWPREIQFPLPDSMTVVPAIGKLHEPGHKQGEDHEQYNLNLIEGSGDIDGESMERLWGEHNNLGNATKTMGPGSREDYIDAHLGSWNWDKYTSMGKMLARKHKDAVRERNLQVVAHEGLTENLPEELTQKWEAMCVRWELAPYPKKNVPNPYHIEEEFISEQKALQELALEEERRLKEGGNQYHAVTATGFVVMALSIQDSQEKLLQAIKEQKREGSVRQSRKLTDQRNALRRRLRAFQAIQLIYMPGLLQHLDDTKQCEDTLDANPENAKLWLPSELPSDLIDRLCMKDVRQVEAKLQLARCFDSLHGVRHTLRVKTRMMLFKNTNIRGQRDSGKSREVINRVVRRARWYAARYRVAREAYLKLAGPGSWEAVLKPLRNEDVRSYRDPALMKTRKGRKGTEEEDEEEEERLQRYDDYVSREEENDEMERDEINLIHPDRLQWEHRSKHGTGESRKELSWIWVSGGRINVEDGADENGNEILRSEWCRSRGRARRAREEVVLVREEMRRTLEYLAWRAQEWEICAEVDMGDGNAEKEGSRAYALAQAELQRRLKSAFHLEWKKPLEEVQKLEELEEVMNDETGGGDIQDGGDDDEGEVGDDSGSENGDLIDGEDSDIGFDGDESEDEQWDPERDGF